MSEILKLDQILHPKFSEFPHKGAETAQNGPFHLCNTIIALVENEEGTPLIDPPLARPPEATTCTNAHT